jgi:hydrogenase expression/formation protein HypD
MRFVDEFRDADKAHALAAKIAALCEPGRQYKIMEVCGGHTHTIYKHGLEDYLPESITLVHGPGCPVCVIPMGRVDDAMALASEPDVIMTSFGDMMRVPGSSGSFFDAKAAGTDIRMVYSPLDSLKIARNNPDKRVVFMAIGFETTAPSTAMTIMRAAAEGLPNFSVFCNHVTIIPAIKAILDSPDLRLDGFLGPGHVSTVIGCRPYEFIARDYGKPVVTAGFEPLDILQSIYMLMLQLSERRSARPWRCAHTSSGAASASSPTPRSACARSTRSSTRNCCSTCPVSGSPTPRPASAVRCSRACSSPGNARCSAPPAPRRRPSAPVWSRPRAPARPTTTTAG